MEWVDVEGGLPEALASAIDEDFYLFTYGDLPPGETAASHYASLGWRQGYDPNPWFSTQAYLEENPGVAEAGQVPLFHYLEIGADEGKECKPSRHAAAYFNEVSDSRRTMRRRTKSVSAMRAITNGWRFAANSIRTIT